MRQRCDFYSDTDPKALQMFLELQRQMTPGEKLARVFDSIEMLHGLVEATLRQTYPNASEREIVMRLASRRLDRDTMIRVYGWDPEVA